MAWLPRTFSIQTRLIAGIALATTVLVVLIAWYWTAREERELTAALDRRAERMSQMVARGFGGPIWNLDTVAVANLLDAVMADPEVHEIEIKAVGVEAEPMLRRRDTALVQPLERQVDILHQASPQSPANAVGRARLVFNREQVLVSVGQTRQLVGSLLAAVLAAIVVTSYWLVHRLVSCPVMALGGLARRVAGGDLGATLPVQRADELGQLTEQFNRMSVQLKASSEGLRRSEERYRSLFENATEGIFQADGRGRLLSVNKALAQMLGYARPEQALAGTVSLRRLAGVELAEFKRVAHALQRHRVLQQVPLLISGREGRQLWVELSVHIVADTDGLGPRIEGMLSDISQRRLAEQELTRHRDHLEELVAERTLELNQARLRAEGANQSKSRFLATMSHEFRTPLNAILGFAQLLQMDTGLSTPQQGKINLIRDSGEHLLSLISDLLDMASIEAGRVRLMPTVVDLRGLLEVACDSLRPRAEEKQLQFRLEIDAELPARVRLDGQRLRQVVLNLLSNAIKFTDAGEVSVRARLLHQDPSAARMRVEVIDTGIGMDEAQMARLFKPFEQVSEIDRRDGGTGLGLSISQQLMRLMDSEISVSSAPGQGSCFSFELEMALQS
ncbi:ATP-binding protein [Paucibacter sp. XJ19-41]|uniref:ATP-binding protein n=1 Tax=Paucibacter sp. XJ19-41 TaxID=2927824 RepID=UPI00234B0405|nr:ATP-binding protein [Paucibacter sp. XJ19-41]